MCSARKHLKHLRFKLKPTMNINKVSNMNAKFTQAIQNNTGRSKTLYFKRKNLNKQRK